VTADPADGYALGRSEAETRRLIVQHQLYGPFTRQFLTAAGDAPMGGGPGWPGYAYVAATVRGLLPFLERAGLLRPDEVGLDTLEDRLRAKVVSQDGIQLLPAVVGGWART